MMNAKLGRLREELLEELLGELLKTMPKEVQKEFMKDLQEAREEHRATSKNGSKLDREEEFEKINYLEQSIMHFVESNCDDLSTNGLLLLMFKISMGIESALKEALGEDYEKYRATIIKSEELKKKHRDEMNKILQKSKENYMRESTDILKGLFR